MSDPTGPVADGVRAYYELWRQEAAEDEGHPTCPPWSELDRRSVIAWMRAYAATVAVSAEMANAVAVTLKLDFKADNSGPPPEAP